MTPTHHQTGAVDARTGLDRLLPREARLGGSDTHVDLPRGNRIQALR